MAFIGTEPFLKASGTSRKFRKPEGIVQGFPFTQSPCGGSSIRAVGS
jgi:hypothetical protein